jgi:CBS domain-containing protein
MSVRDRMSSPAVTITPETRLQVALNLMHQHRSVIKRRDVDKERVVELLSSLGDLVIEVYEV